MDMSPIDAAPKDECPKRRARRQHMSMIGTGISLLMVIVVVAAVINF